MATRPAWRDGLAQNATLVRGDDLCQIYSAVVHGFHARGKILHISYLRSVSIGHIKVLCVHTTVSKFEIAKICLMFL